MTLLLREADVRALLTMPMALEAVEESLRQQGNGELALHPRRRLKLPDNALLHYMAAGDPVHGFMAMKLYTSVRGVVRFVVPLFRSATGEMAALIEADALGQIRTGAATGIATKYLANANARAAGIIGTGYQARTQLEAVAAVRKLERVRAFGRRSGTSRFGRESGSWRRHCDYGNVRDENSARRALAVTGCSRQRDRCELGPEARIGQCRCRTRRRNCGGFDGASKNGSRRSDPGVCK